MSQEFDDKGRPLLHLSPPDITVHSFYHLSNLLLLNKDKQMKEVQTCLEGELHGEHAITLKAQHVVFGVFRHKREQFPTITKV